jgi:SprT-like family
MQSNPSLKKWYRLINRKFFRNELTDHVCVRWAEVDDEDEKNLASANIACDRYHEYEILLNPELTTSWSIKLSSLVHEMIHVATNLRDNHGAAFEEWIKVLASRGLFKKGALQKGRTIF